MDYRQAVERQRNPCNTEPSRMGNPEGVTDTINCPPRSTRRPHSPFPRAPLLPRRSGLCYLTTFRRPFGAHLIGCARLQGLRPCLWSFALSGLRLVRRPWHRHRGYAIAPPLPKVFRLSEALIPAQVFRPFRARLIGCSHLQGLRPVGLHHLPVVYRLSEALIPAQVRRPFRARLIGYSHYAGVVPLRAPPPA